MWQGMTAYESYWNSVTTGHLPAAVPINDSDGNPGIANQPVQFRGNPEAEKLVLSSSWRDRALASIYAVGHARDSIERHYEDIHV